MGISWTPPKLRPDAELVGVSPAANRLRGLIDRVAPTDATVLVTGPSGSGKEVVAQLLHRRSGRAGPFVAINCAAIPRELLESELFGHEAGSFTGAARARPGRFETAAGGTLFLDEIGEMPPDMQAKLLRALESRIVNRVGGGPDIAIDARIVAATNADLHGAIASGAFREDLFYRLAVVELDLPPLAERPEDIEPLIRHFIGRLPASPRPIAFTPAAAARLRELPWRGNVRELRNFVERAATLHAGETLDVDDLPALSASRRPAFAFTPIAPAATADTVDLKRLLDGIEQSYIEQALRRSDGAVARSARLLGLNRTTLLQKMRRLNIERPAAAMG